MQTIQFKVENNYIEIVLNLLNSLKLNVVKNLLVIDSKHEKENELEILDRLFEQSNNKVMVTKENAINTNDISRYYNRY